MRKLLIHEWSLDKTAARQYEQAGIITDANIIRLRKLNDGFTDTGIWRSSTFNPNRARGWYVVDVRALNKEFADINTPGLATSVRYRLHDGTDDFYFDGAAWVIAGANDWNDIETVSLATPLFPYNSPLGVVIELNTSDPLVTPHIEHVKVAWYGDVVELEEYLYRALQSELENIKIEGRAVYMPPAATAVFNISDVGIETPYQNPIIIAAYNETTDPDHMLDLLAAYDENTGEVTLNAPISDLIYLAFTYTVDVTVTQTRQDYTANGFAPYEEIGIVPCITAEWSLERVTIPGPRTGSYALNHSTKVGVFLEAPRIEDIVVSIDFLADKSYDLIHGECAIKKWSTSTRQINVSGMDVKKDIVLRSATNSNATSINVTLVIRFAHFWDTPAREVSSIQTLDITQPTDYGKHDGIPNMLSPELNIGN